MAGVLDGIRVFDLTLAAVGPWSAKLLGQLGADVIHVEGPEPELAHHIPPTVRGAGVLYLAANTNKRSIVVDLKQPDERERALELAATCDVFVQNMRPGAVERLGLGYDAVVARNPAVVYVSASAYGRVGPMAGEAGVDPLVQAFCGWTSVTGPRGSAGELFRHYAHLDLTTSSMIVEAVLAALAVRDRDGVGQHIEIEMLAAALSLQTSRIAEYVATGVAPVPLGSASGSTAPHQAFRCSDGRWLTLGIERDDQWPRLCAALGAEQLAADRGLDTNAGRVARRDELAEAIGRIIATKPAAWWAICCSRHTVPHSRPFDFDELRHHPQVRANRQLVDLDTKRYGTVTLDGVPWTFSDTPADPPRPGADPGTHTAEVFGAVTARHGGAAPTGLAVPAAGSCRPPLDGLVVVEVAEGMAGAFAAARLGDLGAEVIKVERPGGDPVRGHGPELPGSGMSALFAALNRNKRSVVLDLDTPDGLRSARRLVAGADVVIEALPPGEADRLGLTHAASTAQAAAAGRGPGPVWVAVSGWGEQGPLATQPAAELPVQAMAEYLGSLGRIGEEPVRLGADVAALNTAVFAAQAALAGLRTRAATGRSQRVSVSMLGVLLHLRGIMWAARSNPDDWYGFHLDHYTNPPESGYRTADGQVQFGLRRGNSEDFDRLMIRLGLLDRLDDPHFADFGRQAAPLGRYAVEAKPVWEGAFATLTTAELVEEFHARGGDAVPVTDYPAVLDHPQVAAIGALVEVHQPGWGPLRSVAPVWRFAASPVSVRCGAPALGADTAAVLARLGDG